jgi:hypothetical protein
MIHPTSADLLKGVEAALRETVLPELARGTEARKQMQAALEILRRVAHALPVEAATLAADNADMAAVLRETGEILGELSPPPSLPPQGGGIRKDGIDPSDSYPLPPQGGGLGGGDLAAENLKLQQLLNDLQGRLSGLSPEQRSQITPLLVSLHKRMTDRAVALIPPPKARP